RRGAALLALDRAVLERGPGAMVHEDDMEYRSRRYTQTRSVMADAGGKVLGVVIASIDTTERHAMQQALQRERERLQVVASASQGRFRGTGTRRTPRGCSRSASRRCSAPRPTPTRRNGRRFST